MRHVASTMSQTSLVDVCLRRTTTQASTIATCVLRPEKICCVYGEYNTGQRGSGQSELKDFLSLAHTYLLTPSF